MQDRLHINDLWHRYEAYRAGFGAAAYLLPRPNPFVNWRISQRYAKEYWLYENL